MLRKRIAAVLAAVVLVSSASTFAESISFDKMGMYGRVNLGWVNRAVPAEYNSYEEDWYYHMFDLMPAFGLMFAPDSDNIFWRGFGAEVQLDFNFGKPAVINPGVMAKWHYYLPETMPVHMQKIVPYAGLGFSVPIGIIKKYDATSVKAGFDVNLNLGCGYELLPKLMLTLDYDLALGTSIANSIRIGAIWKFKGERIIQQIGENKAQEEAYEKTYEEIKKTSKNLEKLYRERMSRYPDSRAPGETEAEFRARMRWAHGNER